MMRKWLFLPYSAWIGAFAALSYLAACTTSQKSPVAHSNNKTSGVQQVSLPDGKIIVQTRLNNGLSVLLVKNTKAPGTSIYHWVKAGSLHEKPGSTGIAHLFEHMMFRPLKAGAPGFMPAIEALGGDSNASTRFDATVYTTTVPQRNLARALTLESTRFQHMRVNKELLDLERQAVWSEYSTKFDANPVIDLWFWIYRAAFPGHPFGWMIVGFREDLERIDADACNDFFQAHYVPNNVGLLIAGDIDVNQTLSLVEKLYGNWTPGEASKLPPDYVPEAQFTRQKSALPSGSKMLLLGYRLKTLPPADMLTLRLANYILYGADYSLARRDLLHKNHLVSELSEFNFDYDRGLLKVFAVLPPETQVSKVVEHLHRLPTSLHALSEREFNAYATSFRIDLIERIQRNEGLLQELGYHWGNYGDISYLLETLANKTTITRERLETLVTEIVTPSNAVLVTNKNIEE